MALKATLNLVQQQRLVMTPKLQQAIKVLLMSRLELSQHLQEELLENPILDLEESAEIDAQIEKEERLTDVDASDADNLDPEQNTPETDVDRDDIESDINWEDVFDDTLSMSERAAWEPPNEDEPREDVAGVSNLQDHLLQQLALNDLTDVEIEIGELIIGNINEDGWLTVSTEEIAETLCQPMELVEDTLEFIQYIFEPTGVAARDLRECLLLQLEALGEDDGLVAAIVRDHFEDLKNNQLPRISRALDVTIEEIQEASLELAKLDPYPGRRYGGSRTNRIITPDVSVEKVGEEIRVMSNDDGMPRLRLSRRYINMMRNGSRLTSDERRWLEDYRRRALDLLKSIEQRRQTIIKVTRGIFTVQEEFLDIGIKGLKPLVLRQIADMAGVHESTVSRVTTNKYVETPRGIYELKFFFSGGLGNDSGQMTSATSVKETIREMVEAEDPASPLSDQEIVDRLKAKGIKVARRTIAKYRNELGILPSSKRKKKW